MPEHRPPPDQPPPDQSPSNQTAPNQTAKARAGVAAALGEGGVGYGLFDADQRLVESNNAFIDLLGRAPQRAARRVAFSSLFRDLSWNGAVSASTERDSGPARTVRLTAADGRRLTATFCRLADDGLLALLHAGAGGGDRDSREAAAGGLYDRLTRLPKRAVLLDRLQQAIERAGRVVTDRFAVIAFALGDDAALDGAPLDDATTAAAARRLHACARAGDTLARPAPNRFAMVVDPARGDDGAVDAMLADLIRRIAKRMAEPFEVAALGAPPLLRVGVAIGDNRSHPSDVLAAADLALAPVDDAVGDAFGGGFGAAPAPRPRPPRSPLVALTHAVRRGEIGAVYEPVADLRTGRLCGLSAAVTWRHPSLGALSGDLLRELAEGDEALCTVHIAALAAMGRMTAARPDAMLILDLGVLPGPRLLNQLAPTLDGASRDGPDLTLRVDEQALLADPERAAEALGAAAALGVRVCVAGYGLGYANTAFVKAFPVSMLALDRRLIGAVADDAMARARLTAIVRTVRDAGYTPLAVNVTAPAQAAALRSAGCRLAQGDHVSPPLNEAEAAALMRSAPLPSADDKTATPDAPPRTPSHGRSETSQE